MNPDKPSRDEIEAKLTALLLGELPEEEARLLRYTISQDPALTKLHDRLKATIGLVRHVSANPTETAPLKLSADRRQKLLAHFKTPRPVEEAPLVKRMKISLRLVTALVTITIVGLLVAMLLPVLSGAKRHSFTMSLSGGGEEEEQSTLSLVANKKPEQPKPIVVAAAPTIAPPPTTVPPAPRQQIYLPIAFAKKEGEVETQTTVSGLPSQTISGYVNQPLQMTDTLAAQPTPGASTIAASAPETPPLPSVNGIETGPQPPPPSSDEVNHAKSEPAINALQQALINATNGAPTATYYYQFPDSDGGGMSFGVNSGNSGLATFQADQSNTHTVAISGETPAPTTPAPASAGGQVFLGDTDKAKSSVNADDFAINPPGSAPGFNRVTGFGGFGGFGGGFRGGAGGGGGGGTPGLRESSGGVIGAVAGDGHNLGQQDNQSFYRVPANANTFTSGYSSTVIADNSGGGSPANPMGQFPEAALEKSAVEMPSGGRPAEYKPGSSAIVVTTDKAAVPPGEFPVAPSGYVETKDGRKVPIVGDVPLVGSLFSNNANSIPARSAAGTTLAWRNINGVSGAAPASIPTQINTRIFSAPNPEDILAAASLVSNSNSSTDNHGNEGGVNFVTQLTLSQQTSAAAKIYFKSVGVDLSTPGKDVYYNDRTGKLLVKGTSDDLARIDQILLTNTFVDQQDLPLQKRVSSAPIPQPEILTTANAFSTFAMNVSDVSYKLAAASLQKGVMPDVSSIRSEEFINAFDYRDPEAAPGEPIAFTSERAQNPFEQNRDFLRFSIKTAAAGRQSGRPLNLVLLVDNSDSMERADRVAIIREALRVLATQLSAHDTVSIVTFSRTARLWVDGVPGDKAQATFDEVSGLTPQGGTNLEEAMRLAYETARRHYLANGMNRVVLLTDGAANLGTVDAKVLTQKVEENRQQGIALDCFGIGWEDYNDGLLEQLTSHSDGRYAFLNSPADASSDFAAKLAGALQITAEEVKVQVEFNLDRVIAHRQIGYATHQLTKEQFRDNSVAAGEIAAQEAGNALYTVELKPDGSGPIATVRLRYRVPGTTDYRERSWNVDYTGRAVPLDKSSPAMRLAITSAEFAESLAASPYAQQVSLDSLLNDLRGVPESYGADPRPKQLEWMIRQAKSVSGK